MEKRGGFDYILLETTGLADPGNLAPLFWLDEGLGSSIYLDGIVTLVDAKNILKSLDERTEGIPSLGLHVTPHLTTAHLQISHADVIVINKSDLVDAEELVRVKERIQAMNGAARIHVTEHGKIPKLDKFLLDLHAYDDVGEFVVAEHSHVDPVSHFTLCPLLIIALTKTKTISTITVKIPALRVDQVPKLDLWLRQILWNCKMPGKLTPQPVPAQSFEIHRLKARVPLTNGTIKMIQGVRDVFEISDPRDPGTLESNMAEVGGKIVLIGRNIKGLKFRDSFVECCADGWLF